MIISMTLSYNSLGFPSETVEIKSRDLGIHRECLQDISTKLDKVTLRISEAQVQIKETLLETRTLKSEYGR